METKITINFKNICHSCKDRKTYMIEDFTLMIPNIGKFIETTIGCEHERVCKKYIESEEKLI